MEKHGCADIAQRFNRETFGIYFGHVFFVFPARLRRQGLPAGFGAKRNQQQTNGEGDGGQSDGYSERLKMLNACADEKGDRGPAKSRKGRGESESAGAAFGGILFREPKSVDAKISAAETTQAKTNEHPGNLAPTKL